MVNAVIMDEKDSVVTVTEGILKGEKVEYLSNGRTLVVEAEADIPSNHKIAIKKIKKEDSVKKYGEIIGYASKDIEIGEHVHTQNVNNKWQRSKKWNLVDIGDQTGM